MTFHCGIPATFQTYPERDVRALRQVGDPISFQNFLRALAARAGQLLNLTVARNLGIAVNTAKAWLSVLEATFQVIVLRPYHADAGKRLVKTPKVHGHVMLSGWLERSAACRSRSAGRISEKSQRPDS